MLAENPWTRTARQVQDVYLRRPDLIRYLLERLGTQCLKVSARGFSSTCPIHNGDNPQAFHVWIDRGFVGWKCYTRCGGERGDLIKLLMKKYNAPFRQATVWLAKFAGMEISGPILQIAPEQIHEETVETLRRRLGIFSENGPVVFDERWVAQSLRERHPYFYERGVAPNILDRLQVGFVRTPLWVMPDPEKPGQNMGWFDDRVSIPWRDADGRLIGFAGRRLDGIKYQKYQNYPYTKKAYSLYGIWLPEIQEAIRRERHVIFVEGYADAWHAWSLGVQHVLAVGGTEFNPHQIRLLSTRFPDLQRITLFFDGDVAGVTTSRRMSDQLSEVNKVYLAYCPEGKDPDDLKGRDAFLAPVVAAKPVLPRPKAN